MKANHWSLPDDAITAMIGVGIPALMVVVSWAFSTFLCSAYLADLLSTSLHLGTSTGVIISVVVAAMFLAASWAKLTVPSRLRDVGTFAGALILGAWILAAAAHLDLSNVDGICAPWLAVSTAFVTNTAAVKLIDARRAPGVTAHSLYRFFDAAGKLLYIGITGNPRLRFAQHRKAKVWWNDIATREIVHYKTRVDLMAAEREAIIRERPRYNIAHNGTGARR